MVAVSEHATFDVVLAAARAGAAWAVQRLYEDHLAPVASYVRLRGAPDPDDVVSETFLQVFRDLGTFQGDADAFRTWVLTIAHRRVLDDWRRRSRRPREEPIPDGMDPWGGDVEDDVLRRDQFGRVRRILGDLSDAHREVVLLRVVAELSLEETAVVMGRSVGAVKSLQHRAVSALRESINARHETSTTSPAITEER